MPPLLFMTTRILIQLERLLVILKCYSYSNDKFLSSLGEKKEAYVTNLTTNASPPWPRGPWKHGDLGMIIFRKRRTAQSHTTPYLTSTHTLLSSPLILQWEGMHTHYVVGWTRFVDSAIKIHQLQSFQEHTTTYTLKWRSKPHSGELGTWQRASRFNYRPLRTISWNKDGPLEAATPIYKQTSRKRVFLRGCISNVPRWRSWMLYSLRHPFLKVPGALTMQKLSKWRGGKELVLVSLATVFNFSFSSSRIIREQWSVVVRTRTTRARAHVQSDAHHAHVDCLQLTKVNSMFIRIPVMWVCQSHVLWFPNLLELLYSEWILWSQPHYCSHSFVLTKS